MMTRWRPKLPLLLLPLLLLGLAGCRGARLNGWGDKALQANPGMAGSEWSGSEQKNAYATMMYCGTARDYEFFVATRVLLKSLQIKWKVQADLVVIVSEACPKHFVETYKEDGFKVKMVEDVHNPYQGQAEFSRRFLHTLNKLYVWTLTEYKRIVMLDADNVFLRNTDELFQCGEFCAVFINPCIFHTGLFVVEPNRALFDNMVRSVGSTFNKDGADQGFLVSYFPDLIDSPFFRPPKDGDQLAGNLRLPFGYQMDAGYYYFTLSWFSDKWRAPCGTNSIITFPSAPSMKPWFWWSYPTLPLGILWHEQRRQLLGYYVELPIVITLVLVYITLILSGVIIRQRVPPASKIAFLKLCLSHCPAVYGSWHLPRCHPWAIKSAALISFILSFLLPFLLVPTTVHPVMGWTLYFVGSLALLSLLASATHLPPTALGTPWIVFLVNFCNIASPLYTHGLTRILSVGVLSFISSPFLWKATKDVVSAVDALIEREPLMARSL